MGKEDLIIIYFFVHFFRGEVQEWLNWHAWKACILQGIEGSNPSLSACIETP